MDQLQHGPLVAQGEGEEQLHGFPLAVGCLGVGETRLTSQRTGPDMAVAEKMAVEELPAGRERGGEV